MICPVCKEAIPQENACKVLPHGICVCLSCVMTPPLCFCCSDGCDCGCIELCPLNKWIVEFTGTIKVILAVLERDVAAAVLVNGVLVYHEDDDKGATNMMFSARETARCLAKAFGPAQNSNVEVLEVALTYDDVGGEAASWSFGDILEAALRKCR